MTMMKVNDGGDIILTLAFYGPPGPDNALGPVFPLTGWEVRIINPSSGLQGRENLTVTDEANGKARLIFENTDGAAAGTQSFRIQLVRASGPTTSGFSRGFSPTSIQIGSFNYSQFDDKSPYVHLTGPGEIQMTIEPIEAEIIYGTQTVTITADTQPLLAALADGDTLGSAVTWGSYSINIGSISTPTTKEQRVNGGAWSSYVSGTATSAGEAWEIRETVADSGSASEVFTAGPVTVSATLPGQMNAPTLTGSMEGATLTLGAAPDDGGGTPIRYDWEVDASGGDFSAPIAQGQQSLANLGTPIAVSPLSAGDYIARSGLVTDQGVTWSEASAAATVIAAPSDYAAMVEDIPNPNDKIEFGADTPAGYGGYETTQTAITSDGGTNLEIAGSVIVPKVGGGVNSGTITFGDGSTKEVEAVANAHSVRSIGQLINRLQSGLTRGTDKVLIRSGVTLNPDSVREDVTRSSEFPGTDGHVLVTGHSNEPMPRIGSIGLNTQNSRPPSLWLHFDRVFFKSDPNNTGLQRHLFLRGTVHDCKVTNCFFGYLEPEQRGDAKNFYFGIYAQNDGNRRWEVKDNVFHKTWKAASNLWDSEYERNLVDVFSKDAHQYVGRGCVVAYNMIKNLRKPVSIHTIDYAEVSPANPAWTRFYIPGHQARTNLNDLGEVGSWGGIYFVLRNLDPGLSALEATDSVIEAATVDWVDVSLDPTSYDLALFSGGEMETTGIHSDVFQLAGFQPGAPDSPARTRYGYDYVFIGNVAHLGDCPEPYAPGAQFLFFRSGLTSGATPPFGDALVAYNTGPFGTYYGLTFEDSNHVTVLNNVLTSGQTYETTALPEETFISFGNTPQVPERCIIANNITHQLQNAGSIPNANKFNNLFPTLTELTDVFVDPSFYPNQTGQQAFRDAYTSAPAIAAAFQGAEGTGLYDFNARTAHIPPYMVDTLFIENTTDFTFSGFCADRKAQFHYIISDDLLPSYTNNEIQNAAVAGNIVEVGTFTASEAEAGVNVASGLVGSLFKIHISVVNTTPVSVDPIAFTSIEQEALDWASGVEATQGTALPSGVLDAVDKYIKTAKTTSSGVGTDNWAETKLFVPLVGPNTLAAALANPVKGAYTQTPFSFTETDYDPSIGLTGDGATKYIQTNYADTEISNPDHHHGLFHLGPRQNNGTIYGNKYSTFGSVVFSRHTATNLGVRFQTNGYDTPAVPDTTAEGVYGWHRKRLDDGRYYAAGNTGLLDVRRNGASLSTSMTLFAVDDNGIDRFMSGSMQAYSLGGAVDTAIMGPAMETLISEIRAALASG